MARETGIPPLALLALVATAMWLVDRLVPPIGPEWPSLAVPALAVGACGLVVGALALLPFVRWRTTVDPRHPERASRLVTHGIFRASRNPMYLAMLLGLIAWGLWLGHAPALLAGPAFFVAYLNRRQIPPEERALAAMFGEDYERYRREVRRWL
jgi:protein-S-isoprenylcysteine O-methyltransferase Ste14